MSDTIKATSGQVGELTVWRYVLHGRGLGDGWAIVLMDATGFFSVVSDYGNYGFRWTAFGDNFRAFITKIDAHYALTKLAYGQEAFDGEATEARIRKGILELRRHRHLSKDDARKEWDLLGQYDVTNYADATRWYDDTELGDAAEYIVHDYPKQALAFCEKVLPRLQAHLREELAAERAPQKAMAK